MEYTLSTTIEGPVDCTVSQIIASVLDAPQQDGWPERTRYTDAELVQYAKSWVHWTDVFGFRTAGQIGRANHETNHLRYTGDVPFGSHNFAGLGATGGVTGRGYDSIDAGVLAVCAHQAAYTWGDVANWPEHLPQYVNASGRHRNVLEAGHGGKVKTWGDFTNGRWAWTQSIPVGSLDNGYARACVAKANRVLAQPGGQPMAAQIPGFQWYPADSDHYERGRREQIRGGAQHYTAGTNSLDWLAKTSKPEVSVHFLVKHTPTLDDRGWQLVRIEDTAWTTAFANPYTVAIEYEHDGTQSIPDIAYEVLATTWRDIAAYVRAQGLGEVPLTRAGLRGHKEWVNSPTLICPDGIDVDRIVREAQGGTSPPPPPPPPDEWPKVPTTERDPQRERNPYGKAFWVPKVFVADIKQHAWHLTGYCLSEAFAETGDDGVIRVVQYFERARLELWQDGRVTRGLCGREVLYARYPERAE